MKATKSEHFLSDEDYHLSSLFKIKSWWIQIFFILVHQKKTHAYKKIYDGFKSSHKWTKTQLNHNPNQNIKKSINNVTSSYQGTMWIAAQVPKLLEIIDWRILQKKNRVIRSKTHNTPSYVYPLPCSCTVTHLFLVFFYFFRKWFKKVPVPSTPNQPLFVASYKPQVEACIGIQSLKTMSTQNIILRTA